MKTAGVVVLACVAAALAAFSLLRTPSAPPAEAAKSSAATSPPASASADEVPTVAVYGDSVSNGASVDFSAGRLGDLSWVKYLDEEKVHFAGGHARPGMTSKQADTEVHRRDADLQVVALGTNDRNLDITPPFFVNNLAKLAKVLVGTSEQEKRRLVVVAVGPTVNEMGIQPSAWNAQVKAMVIRRGWSWVDPWGPLRKGDRWASPTLTEDGLHPTAAGARVLGREMSRQLAKVAAGS